MRTQLRRVFRIVNGGTPTSGPENWDGDVAWATPVDLARVNGGRIEMTDRTLTKKGLAEGSRLVPPGSLILSTRAPIGYVAECTTSMAFNQGCRGLVPRGEADARYFRYQLSSLTDVLGARGQGSTFVELSGDALAGVEINMPPHSEQRAIADYLDTETARIDALIDMKQRMIDVARERQVVSETTSVFPEGTLATGIPTIPTVPDGWRVLRNKVFMREVNLSSKTGEEEMLSVSHLTGVTPRSEKTVYMFEAESTVGYKTVRSGDLVINTMWAWMGAAGVARVNGIVSPAYGVYGIDSGVMTPDYFDIVVRTSAYITEMTRFSRGVTSSRLRLYPEEFLALSSPVPPIEEQERIVARCFAARERTASLVERLERQVDLLREHRQALITAAVTGELEIPGVAA